MEGLQLKCTFSDLKNASLYISRTIAMLKISKLYIIHSLSGYQDIQDYLKIFTYS